MTAPTTGMYLDFSIPLSLANLIQQAIGNSGSNPNTPQLPSPTTTNRLWVSQPRPGIDRTIEVITVNFKLPLSVSEVGWEALRVGCHYEIWYQDRQNNWRQLLDESRNPVTLNISGSQAAAWYKAHFFCYPIVAKALQFRINRVYDPNVGNVPYCVGMRNGLIRRNIYVRSDGTSGIEPQQDVLGNTFTSYIKDWDASKAYDNDPNTFWRSMPMPDPQAVVSLYLDLRTPGGGTQLVDTIYVDPVYSGGPLNVYYSNDDTVGTRLLSPVSATATLDENTQWQQGKGRWDISPEDDSAPSNYEFPLAWGPLVNQNAWVGIEWTPDFGPGFSNATQVVTIGGSPADGTWTLTYGGQTTNPLGISNNASDVQFQLSQLSSIGTGNVQVTGAPGGPFTVVFVGALAGQPLVTMGAANTFTGGTSPTVTVHTTVTGGVGGGPPQNPVLLQVTPDAPGTGQYWPVIYYDVGAGEVVLEFTNGTVTHTYATALSSLFAQYSAVRIVAGWTYSPNTIYLSVADQAGNVIGTQTWTNPTLPALLTLDGNLGFTRFRGLFTAHVIKLEDYHLSSATFQANPQMYVSPDPVQPDTNGNIPSTSLDNAIYAAAWAMQEHGTGGSHESHYDEKLWTPVWANYICQKGKLFLPQQIPMKYLKLEFTNLTEEPYPIYDSGIQVSYNIFPVSVSQTITQRHPGLLGLLTVGADVLLTGIGTVNWLNPSTVNNAVNSVFGQTVSPLTVTTSPGFNTSTLPNTTSADVAAQTSNEVSSPWVYKRTPPDARTIASNVVRTTASSDSIQTMPTAGGTIGAAVNDAFTPLTNWVSSSVALPTQGADWWVFPGATLRLPATIMSGLTAITQTILGRPPTVTRLRFDTASVHRYETRTAIRDAAVGYFAGIREVQPYVTTYIASQDPPEFRFSQYDASQWVLTNVRTLDTGPITTSGIIYSILNPGFDADLGDWIVAEGTWTYDRSEGHWYPGTARVTADGTEKILLSSEIDVAPGAHLDASVWVTWTGLTATSGLAAIALQAQYFNNGTFVSAQTQGLTNSPWPATTPEVGGNTWAQVVASNASSTGFTVPAGVNQMRLGLVVTTAASAGQIWFDTVEISTPDTIEGTAFKDFITTSTFARLNCDFFDSGLVLSDDMWAQADPNDTNISSTSLAYYTSTIPDQIPAGMWGDTFATWGDPTIVWGEPRAVVAINVDPDRLYDGKRVLHFTRAGGAEEAGVKVRQVTNFVANGLFRIGCVFLKPTANTNQITVRLRRISDGVYIHEETFDPVVGYWYKYLTPFIEVPDSSDQVYTVEMVLSGDAPDELYLNDLYTEVAHIRYFVRLGDESQFNHDVTALAYADTAVVSTTVPVNEFSVTAAILSPRAFAYSATLRPLYLK